MPNPPHTVNTLAQDLAHIAHRLQATITTILTSEEQQTMLHTHLNGFRQTLLPNLAPTEFADMYAQTLVYGLFAARVALSESPTFTRYDAAQAIPKTNPFLREMFYQVAGIHLDERIAWLVDNCARLLDQTDMTEVLRDFGKATRQEDPIVHFYETFLAAYDPKTREMRGVYYTPEPVVSYIVRSVDHLLQTCFGKPMGLAEDDTLILDPATGTATFLHTVVQHIYATLQREGLADTWNQYVPEKLLPRLFGFELLMAPYTIAHLKLSMLLQQLGYTFDSQERLGVYLTNALIDLPERQTTLPFTTFIVQEGQDAREVKQTMPVMVVLGNPPYSGHSANASWETVRAAGRSKRVLNGIGALLQDYYTVDGQPLGERNPKWLQDDYVKFIRFGQWRISQTGEGILAFISNNSYLDNPTFRGMRQSLLQTFDTIYLLNLHGNSKKKEHAPDGSLDENVFDIQQGVAIGLFIKHSSSENLATVYYADLWGDREGKYAALMQQDVATTLWQQVKPASPWYLFLPQNTAMLGEYEQGWAVPHILPLHSVGIVTARDRLTVQWSRQEMVQTVEEFGGCREEEAREKYALGADARDWKVALAQQDIQHHSDTQAHITPILYRPFDQRYTYYTGKDRGFLCRPRSQVMRHILKDANIGFITIRRSRNQAAWNYWFVAAVPIAGATAVTALDINYFFPLYLYPTAQEVESGLYAADERRPNLSDGFMQDLETRMKLAFIPDGSGDLMSTVGPEDVFHYLYAVLHSPTYRSRYAELLKIDFPRIPITSDTSLFKTLVGYGAALVDLHLLRTPSKERLVGGAGGASILAKPGEQGVTQHQATNGAIGKITYDETQQRVMLDTNSYFAGVEPSVWTMQIGGYQPLQKWLKDRKGRTLSFDEVVHYMRMVVALRETQHLMLAIDAAIPGLPLR